LAKIARKTENDLRSAGHTGTGTPVTRCFRYRTAGARGSSQKVAWQEPHAKKNSFFDVQSRNVHENKENDDKMPAENIEILGDSSTIERHFGSVSKQMTDISCNETEFITL
jgi:hypothetical protein